MSRSMKVVLAILTLIAIPLTAAACSQEEPQEFTNDNRDGFLAACTEQLEDTRLTSAICQCVFDESQVRIPFVRFTTIERELQEDRERELPEELVDIIAQCVIDEGEL